MKLESSFLPLGSSLPPPLDRHSRVSFVVIPAKAGETTHPRFRTRVHAQRMPAIRNHSHSISPSDILCLRRNMQGVRG